MRHIWTLSSARRFGIGVLAAGLLAGMAPAVNAAAKSASARGPAPTRLSIAALARARAASTARAATHTGVISGVIHSAADLTLGGACVTASKPGARATAKTGPDGRYVLGGLRPGQYRISVGACASRPSGHELISVYWTSGSTSVTVRAGRISDPAPISTWHLDLSSVTAAAHQAPSTSTASAKTGSISGLVTGHGRPLRGICAAAIPVHEGQDAIAFTSKAGKYKITRLRPGRYDVVFVTGVLPCPNNGDWLPQWYDGVNSLIPTAKVKQIRVRAGKDTGGIDGRLKEGGQISGTVRAKSGKPLSGICANVIGSLQGGEVEVEYNLRTNKAGQYAARGLVPAGYQAEFMIGCGTKANYATQWWPNRASQARAKTIRITGTKHVTNINATMRPGASVSGVVKAVNAAGKPLANVCVFVSDPDGNFGAFGMTARDGRYKLDGLAAGRFTIQFDPTCTTGASIYLIVQRSIKFRVGQAITGFNAFLPVGGGISGLVTDAHGQPVRGVCVQINDDNGDLTRTGANGHYSLAGVENGSFQVMFFGGCGNAGSVAPQFYPNSPTSLFSKLVKFRPNTITANVDATMRPGGSIAGLVTDTIGHRLSRVCVTTASTSPSSFETTIETGSATAEAGKYLIQNLAPGAYYLAFACGGYAMEFFPSQITLATASLIAVNPGATTKIPAERLSRPGAMTGTVITKAGKPVQNICVQLSPLGGEAAFFGSGFAVTGAKGHYRVGGLPPARYRIQFTDCSYEMRFATQWYRRQSSEASATAVKVFSGLTVAGINAVMQPGGTITGLVTGPTGKPANACIFAFNKQAQAAAFSQTGKAGRYRLTELSTGRWSLTFAPCFAPKPDLASVSRPGTVRVVAPRTVTNVNFKMTLAGSVSGRITADGKALANVCVLLQPTNALDSSDFAFTDGNGYYTAPQLGAGNYHAYLADPGCQGFPDAVPPFAPQWFSGQPTQATAKAVHVSAGRRTTGINGALVGFGAVTGTVITRSHAAVGGECVTAVPFRGATDPVTGIPAQQEVAATGHAGGYTLTALTPGRYKIEFTTGCGATGLLTQWWDNATSAASAKVITVRFATITNINATLHR